MAAAGSRAMRAAALLLAIGCAGARGPLARARLEAPFGPEVPPPPPAAEEPAPPPPPVPPPEPDRTQAPWSQTPFTALADGAVEESRDAGGRHLRLGTPRGTVHVWVPPGYARRTAGIVLYVHGYYTNVDQAFADHDLAGQFRASGLDAVFIAPEAPDWNGAPVYWSELGELLREVEARTKLKLPDGPVVVSGHSGAIRTVLPWLAEPRVEEIVLLDGLYRGEDELAAWLAAAPAGRRRLLLVGLETASLTEAWLPSLGATAVVTHPRIPARLGGRERRATVVYCRSQYDHMALVTGRRVLPLLLRATRVRPLD